MLRLQLLRERGGLSRNDLGRLADLGHGFAGQVELGRVRPRPDSKPLQRMAIVLGLPPEDAGLLLDVVDEPDEEASSD